MLPSALEGTRAIVVGCVHDEILLEAPIECADEVAEVLKDMMEQAGNEFLRAVPVQVEMEVLDS